MALVGSSGPGRRPGSLLHRPAPKRSRHPAASAFPFLLICIWITSLTVGLDVLGELKAYDICAALGFAVYSGLLLRRLKQRDAVARAVRYMIAAGIFGSIVALVRVEELSFAPVLAIRLFRFAGYLGLFMIVSTLGLGRKSLNLLLQIVFLSALAQAILIAFQSLGVVPNFWPDSERIYGSLYPTGTLGLNHLNSVLFMTVGLCAGLSLAFMRHNPVSLVAGLTLSCATMIYAMLAGEARSSLVASVSMALMMMRRIRGLVAVGLIAAMGLGLGYWAGLDIGAMWAKVWKEQIMASTSYAGGSLSDLYQKEQVRPDIWRQSAQRLAENPSFLVIGAGFQNFQGLEAGRASAGHNLALHVLGELGVPGLLAYGYFLFVIYQLLRQTRDSSNVEVVWLSFFGRVCFWTILILGVANESLYPQRAIPGFMGYCLAFFAIAAHRGWRGSSTDRGVGKQPGRPRLQSR